MLFYNPPFLMVGPVTVFPDHADPEAFYYIVSVPQLVTDGGEPAFWATAILPPATVGTSAAGEQAVGRALVSFDINLPLPDDPENILRKEIQKHWGREPKRLVAAPLQNGKVSLTVARPNAGEPNKEFFVYEGHAPSLVGDNHAALAIAAEGKEAQALVASMAVGHLAAVVTYDLEFPGLAPSFDAHMVVHWKTVYHRFRSRDTTNFIFAAEEVDKTVEELKDSHAIEIEVKELDPDGAKAATRTLFDELKSQVMKKLFESPMPTGDTPIEERIGRGVREILTSVMPGVTHTLRTLDQASLSDTTIELREQQVNTYKFYPQSTLAGLLSRADDAANRLTFVRVEDLPHRTEEIIVEIAGGAARLGVRGVEIRVRATVPGRDEPLIDQSLNLTSATPERNSIRYRRLGTEEPSVQYQIEMLMDPERAPGGKERWIFDWREVEGNRVWFDPEEWLDVSEVRLEIDDPAIFDTSKVSLYLEAWLPQATAPLRKANIEFSKDTLSQSFSLVVPDDQVAIFKGRETFRRIGEPDFVREIPAITGAIHRIMNPFGQSWTMEIHAVSTWEETASLFCEFRVWDVLRKVWLFSEQQFQKSAPIFTLRLSTSLETPRKAEVRTTRISNDGKIVRGPWKDLRGLVVAITDEIVAQRRIRMTLSAPQFREAGVQKVLVDLEYQDLEHNIHETASPAVEFTQDGAIADWTHAFPDPTRPFYRFRTRARSENGDRYSGSWSESGADDLAITLPANPWSA